MRFPFGARLVGAGLVCWLICLPNAAAAAAFDWNLYGQLLARHAIPNMVIDGYRLNAVDYQALAQEKEEAGSPYQQLLAQLAAFDPDKELESREEKIAFWLNAYNLGAIKTILDHWPVDSIRSWKIAWFGMPWGKLVINIGGRDYSLDEIEHAVLMDRLGEPRAHFGLTCASLSCPQLRREPYLPERLWAQLEDQGKGFLNDPKKGVAVDRERGVVRISKIFDWSKDDFEAAGGPIAFLTPYLDPPERDYLAQGGYKVEFLEYDWKLNAAR